MPIASKFLWPLAKNIGDELIVQAAPEPIDVVKRKSAKQATKPTVQKTVKQVGGSKTERMPRFKTNGEKTKKAFVRRGL